MATLTLNKLRCKRKQDITGKDEPRIKVDGVPIWNGVVEKDQSVSITRDGAPVFVPFENQARVILEEMNGTEPKQIGAAVIVRESGNPEFLTFKTSGAWYEVYFVVTG